MRRGHSTDIYVVPLHLLWRQFWLTRALKHYPIYDPPHKIEERILPKERALENFEYFMSVRQQRVEAFRCWLRRYFWTEIQANEEGVAALNLWAFRHVALLIPNRKIGSSYYSYDPPWDGEAIGCNVLLDIGITLGEFIIANCPRLRWEIDTISAIRPNAAKALKADFGSSFQRPDLTGFDNPRWGKSPLSDVPLYAFQMRQFWRWHFVGRPKGLRKRLKELMLKEYINTIKEYAAGDPYILYGHPGPIEEIGEDYE
jgi:hypothetical protein